MTSRIEEKGAVGLILADFELLYAYDLGGNDISIARQVAINGKRVCLLVPGAMRDGRLWIFDEDPESRREFPDALVFKNTGWVFELTPGECQLQAGEGTNDGCRQKETDHGSYL